MAAPLNSSDDDALREMSCSKEATKAFLKRHKAEDCWRAIGVTPPAVRGARKGSPLAAQIALHKLVDDLYKKPVAPGAFETYRRIWGEIVDRVTGGAWSSPSTLSLTDPDGVTTLVSRVLNGAKPVSREDLEEVLEAAPFDTANTKNVVLKLPARDTIDAKRSIDGIRTALGAVEARLSEALGRATSPAEFDELRNAVAGLQTAAKAQSREAAAAAKKHSAEISHLKSSLDEMITTDGRLREQVATTTSELNALRLHFEELTTLVRTIQAIAPKESAIPGAAAAAPSAVAIPIKPVVKILDRVEDPSVTTTQGDQVERIAATLRGAGLAKQSAHHTAVVVSASLVASGWLNVSGSLSGYFASGLVKAAYARHALVNIPVGCLEPVTKAPGDWAGVPTIWQLLGFDRAPVQVTSRFLKSYAVHKLVTRKSEHFVIAIHEGGDICRGVLSDAAQLGAWIDTDALDWTGRMRSDGIGRYNPSAFVSNETAREQEQIEHRVDTALGKLLEARFFAALGSFISDEALMVTLLERHIIAPACAGDMSVDLEQTLTDQQARRIATHLRAL